jgi:hypothetical protein
VKRQSIPLERQNGHICSLLIQGLAALDVADPAKDVGTSPNRAVIDFEVDEAAGAIKFVGRWYDVNQLRFNGPTPNAGPIIPLLGPDGVSTQGCLVASPHADAKHVLILTCQPIPKLGPVPEVFMFYGGFDPSETMSDLTKEAGFLAFSYPIADAENIKQRIGSVDFVRGPTS